MKELNRTGTKMPADSAEPIDVLDESTREIVDSYSRKFLSFVQQEKDRIRRQALEESEKILAEADKKSRLAAEKSVREAKTQAEIILSSTRESVGQATSEAQRLFDATIDLKDRVEHEIDELRQQLRQEADALAESIRMKDQAIAEAKDGLMKEFEASAETIAGLKQQLEEAAGGPILEQTREPSRPVEFAEPRVQPKAEREQPAERSASKEDNAGKRHNDKTFVGTLNLDVDKGNPALSKRFKETLSRVPGLDISVADDSAKDKTRIVAFASRPLPLLNILHQMSLVKSAVADDEGIRVTLQESDRWVG